MSAALYQQDGDYLVPSPITEGPWDPDAQHGGAVAALMARTAEGVPAPVPMQVVRLTIELLRPVPMQPLETSVEVTRPGRKVQVIETRLSANGRDVAWARALRIRTKPTELPDQEPVPPSPPGAPEDTLAQPPSFRVPFAEAVDIRFVAGSWTDPGPVTIWTRLTIPVVAGEVPSPLQRVAAGADFGNGVSRILDFNEHVFINPDLAVSLSRVPDGEWIGFDVRSRLSPDGWGQAESLVFDRHGPVGRSVQSLIVEPR